jgi:hypothetical protein
MRWTIIARILKDENIGDTIYLGSQRAKAYLKYADVIRKYVDQWGAETADPKAVSRKFEELVWMNVVRKLLIPFRVALYRPPTRKPSHSCQCRSE